MRVFFGKKEIPSGTSLKATAARISAAKQNPFDCGCYLLENNLVLCKRHEDNLRWLMARSRYSPWGPWNYRSKS